MNFLGINGGELVILIVLALLLLGPEKIPEYTQKLRDLVRSARTMFEGAKVHLEEETGVDFEEIDWQKYDPRQYDPRRVVRQALTEPLSEFESLGRTIDSVGNTLRSEVIGSEDIKNHTPSNDAPVEEQNTNSSSNQDDFCESGNALSVESRYPTLEETKKRARRS